MASPGQVYSVGELTHYIKFLLEENEVLKDVRVSGEVSNLKYHSSGHVYFSIKDSRAQMSCVMFRGYATLAPKMRDGEKVVLKGNMSVYPPRGNYQLMVKQVQKAGLGDLHQKFLALKEKLQKEGLFDPMHKKPVPQMPRKIAVITSPTGAAVRDIIRTIRRRFDKVKILIIPTIVQGDHGKGSILQSLQLARSSQADVIILARGGGSIEDLWNFNEEAVARAIFDSNIPIITGIGHETDFTIADFVADLRASTPTAAAEHSVPDKSGILALLKEYEGQLQRNLQHFIDFKRQVMDDYSYRLQQAFEQFVRKKRHELELLETQLMGMDRTGILKQGYSLTLKDGKIVNSSTELSGGDKIETVFSDGRVGSTVDENI